MAANSDSSGSLKRYRAKRAVGRTPEPFGSAGSSAAGPGRFVVQKHAATRLHYDFRLELGGILMSWAVPRGPSLLPLDKRMAVMVENHPVEYADFEGVIPEGNYGAGAVIVWDRGVWTPVEDPESGLEKGKLLFDLHGHKLRGRWTLVRTKRSGAPPDAGERPADGAGSGEWLLIKKPDGYAIDAEQSPPPETSVLSGLELEDVAGETDRLSTLQNELDALDEPRRTVDIRTLRPMLCQPEDNAFDGDEWLFELKYDGFRLLATTGEGRPHLRYRSGNDSTALFPEICLALQAMPYRHAIFDGEVVAFDNTGRPDFGRLQGRALLGRTRDVSRAAKSNPVRYMVFDLLAMGGIDLRDLPLLRRKQLLRGLVADTGIIRYVEHLPSRGRDFFASVEGLGLEGMVGKRADSPYKAGRSAHWLKVRTSATDDFVVVGYTEGKGGPGAGFGALHLAVRDGQSWLYAGKVGSGFRDRDQKHIAELLADSAPASYDFAAELSGDDHFVDGTLVVTVQYKEWLPGGSLRHPRFVATREDKSPDECLVPERQGDGPAVVLVDDQSADRTVTFSNLKKVFWPETGITKGDLIDYYRTISPWLLPYLADRPLVLTRYPDGVDGKSFYQKDAPEWVPPWIRTESIWSAGSSRGGWSRNGRQSTDEHEGGREIHYFVCDNVESLEYIANLGTIPLHVWSSTVTDLAKPDWCIIDLDPKGAPFVDVVKCALAIRRLCDAIELPTRVKTSGSTGLHILIPLGRQMTYEHSRALAGLIVQLIEAELPDICTTARVIDARGGKVYLDWLQNRHGQLLAAPFSARPTPGATVSMPLRWREVTAKLDHTRFTIANARRRMDRLGGDPLADVLQVRPDLMACLARLQERLSQN